MIARLEVLARSWVADLYRAVPEVDAVRESRGHREDVVALRGQFDLALLLPNSFAAALPAASGARPRRSTLILGALELPRDPGRQRPSRLKTKIHMSTTVAHSGDPARNRRTRSSGNTQASNRAVGWDAILQERAARMAGASSERIPLLDVDPVELARAAVSDLLSTPDEDFRAVAHHVLRKYSEFYRRLAQCST